LIQPFSFSSYGVRREELVLNGDGSDKPALNAVYTSLPLMAREKSEQRFSLRDLKSESASVLTTLALSSVRHPA
jgi:hypothetical protein